MTFKDLIINSKTMRKDFIPAERYYAPLTLYHFDKFTVEVCHNTRPQHVIKVMGDRIGQLDREDFERALKMRTERLKKELGV